MKELIQKRPQYTSISEIQQRKAELLEEIRKDNKEISSLWHGLYNKPAANNKKGFSVSGLINAGTGVVDGMLFAWKLYRKFRR